MAKTITAGDTFDTPFESGCHAISEPDVDGNFHAYDSDGVVCLFNVSMVLHNYGRED